MSSENPITHVLCCNIDMPLILFTPTVKTGSNLECKRTCLMGSLGKLSSLSEGGRVRNIHLYFGLDSASVMFIRSCRIRNGLG
jgi:hypothetical protein